MSASSERASTLSQSTFVGRHEELAEIVELLSRPNCRLVTLLGPGGVGKTRLALEAGGRFARENELPMTWVGLEGTTSVTGFAFALADAIGLRTGEAEPDAKIIEFLSERELLLVLDNFEDVVAAAPVVGRIAQSAPGVKVLVTSRQALNLAGEWRFSVRGLPAPAPGKTEITPAVDLFLQRAQQVSGGAVTDEDHRHIATIVRMLDGVPLALELAAAWSGTLSFEEIAGEVQRGLDLLATRAIDRPDRHQSMRAVFVQTIMRLSADELSAFRGLCVFRGGFEREAAEKVAGANLPLLSALSDKSLVWRGEDGRFRVHELLRQYASEILLTPGEEAEQLGARHSDYYLGYLGSMWSDVIRGSQAQAAEAVKREKENVLAALRYATENKRFKGIGQVLHAFSLVEQFSGRYGEGVEVINGALDALQAEEPTQDVLRAIAQSAVDVAWLCLRVGLIDQSRQRIRQAEDAYAALSVPPLPGASTDPTLVSGVIALIQGDFVQAEKLGRHSAELAKRDNQNDNYPYSLYVLAGSALGRGDYEQARAYGLEAYEASRRENPWFTAYCLIELGTACAALGERDAAQRYFQESFDIRKTFSDPEGMALALNRLGELELDGKNYREAERLYAQSLRYYRETDDIGGRAASRRGLAEAYCGLGKHEASAGMLREALQDALRIGFVKQVLTIILCSGELLARAGKPEPAGRLLRWVIGQPAADKETIDRAHSLIGPDARPGEGLSLQEAADFADRELAAVVDHARPAMADAEALPEPLTERELEVLYYLADGMTNQQIAEKLIVSLGTIKAHTHAIFGKLGAENRVQAVSRAREAGLLS